MDTPTTRQGGTGKTASTTDTSGTASTEGTTLGTEPSTPAMGASTPTANPTAGDINVDDTGSRLGEPNMNQSADGAVSGSGGQRFARAKEQAREQATKLKGQATERARTAAESSKQKAVGTIDGLAQAARETADRLGEQNPQAAEYARKAADAITNFSRSLEQKSVDDLVDDARQLVRRSPGVAVGAAVAVGFILARFLKATSPARDPRSAGRSSYRTASYEDRTGNSVANGSSYRATSMRSSDSNQSFTA